MSTIASHARQLSSAAVIAAALGAAAIGAIAPAQAAPTRTLQESCLTAPGAYADGAVRGVYHTERNGLNLDKACEVFGVDDAKLGTYWETDYGFYGRAAATHLPAAGRL